MAWKTCCFVRTLSDPSLISMQSLHHSQNGELYIFCHTRIFIVNGSYIPVKIIYNASHQICDQWNLNWIKITMFNQHLVFRIPQNRLIIVISSSRPTNSLIISKPIQIVGEHASPNQSQHCSSAGHIFVVFWNSDALFDPWNLFTPPLIIYHNRKTCWSLGMLLTHDNLHCTWCIRSGGVAHSNV